MKVLSLFSGCGGMDLGLEGGFLAHKSSINNDIYASHVVDHDVNYVYLKKTGFETVFANDILPFAKLAWCNFYKFSSVDINGARQSTKSIGGTGFI